MHSKLALVLLYVFFATALCSCDNPTAISGADTSVILKFNLHTNSTYKYIIDSKLTLRPEVKGQTLNITQNIKLVSTLSVLGSNRFGKNIMINYDRIIMASDNGSVKHEYDSDDRGNNEPLFMSVGAIINKPYKLLIKDNGVVMTSINNDTAFFSDSSMRKMLMQCLNVYPQNAVKPGEFWQREYNTSTGFLHMHIANTFVLSGVKDSIAHIDISGKVTPEDSTQNMPFKGVQTGTMDIDVRTGIIVSSKISQQLSGNIKVGGKLNTVNAAAEISIIHPRL